MIGLHKIRLCLLDGRVIVLAFSLGVTMAEAASVVSRTASIVASAIFAARRAASNHLRLVTHGSCRSLPAGMLSNYDNAVWPESFVISQTTRSELAY
jgi:hypothetical protein